MRSERSNSKRKPNLREVGKYWSVYGKTLENTTKMSSAASAIYTAFAKVALLCAPLPLSVYNEVSGAYGSRNNRKLDSANVINMRKRVYTARPKQDVRKQPNVHGGLVQFSGSEQIYIRVYLANSKKLP